ncbi:MAG TPA: hypothetical protein VNL95_07340 [Dehalococcoidia bacterium]|nr:hypothetical protein [Dehalococcoidia bacterium]
MTVRSVALVLLAATLLATACARQLAYDRPEFEIRGNDNDERVRSIASVVRREFKDVVAVPSAEIVTDDRGTRAEYLVVITVPRETFFDSPSSTQQLQAQQDARSQVNSAIATLLRLSMRHLVPRDLTIRSVVMTLVLPDGEVLEAVGQVDQLKGVPDDAPAENWLERLSVDRQVVVPESVWQDLLNRSGLRGATPTPRR